MSWRVARSLETLLSQFNATYPRRSKASDGSIGDAAHASRTSDHNPWFGPGIVTARDFTHDPANGMDIDRLTDELAASRDNRIKYIIANAYILDSRPGNSPWKWVKYNGSNPHTKHFHLSVMDNASCDDPRAWDLPSFRRAGTPAPAPNPTPTPGQRVLYLTTPNMVGADVKTVQERLNRDYPSYSKLTVDSVFGQATDKVVREFQRRAGLTVDGAVGPATRSALHL